MLHLAHDWVFNYFWVWARLYKWDRFIWNLPILGLQPSFLCRALLALHKFPVISNQLTSISSLYFCFMFFTNRITPGEGKDTPSEEWWDMGKKFLCGIKEHPCCLLCKYNMPLTHHLCDCGHLSLRPWHMLAIVYKTRHPLLEAGKRVLNLGPL